MDVTRHDPDFGRSGSDDSRTIWANQTRSFSGHLRFHAHHVHHWNALRDAHHQLDTGVDGFEDGIGRARRWHKDHRDIATGLSTRLRHRVEHRNFVVEFLSAFSRRHARDDISSVFHALARMKGAGAAGDSLHHEASVLID